MSVDIVRHHDTAAFADRTRPFLMRDEAEHCFILSLPGSPGPSPLWLTAEADGEVVGVAAQTRPIALAMTRLAAEACGPLVDHLAGMGWSGQGFIGPGESVDRVADLWAERSGRAKHLLVALRLFKLTAVTPPPRVSGQMTLAPTDQLDLIARWHDDFNRHIGQPADDPRAAAQRILDERRLFAWEDNGQLRALAAISGPTPSGIRINHVYTPPEFRGRGYASNLVAALSQRMLDAGRAFCSLFTDQANPTSNKIYRQLGYRPIADFRHWKFGRSE